MRRAATLLAVAITMLWATGTYAGGNGALHATAVLRDAAGQVVGVARFTEDATGTVHVNVHVKGIAPGLHGIHIHAIGVCDGTTPTPFSSAGGHFNPSGAEHGLHNPAGPHAGDMPNLTVNGAGVGHLNAKTDNATLSASARSVFDADGSALVIHAMPDDQVTNPTGNSGGRIACGVITAED
ncbi:MAG TPA: superoxide dismutase family protein [Roseiflexaceae bacterium]|nr:superoxide dismutase family protein [Roseiflexaceae bacterium]